MEPKDPKLAVETVPKAPDIRCCKAFMLVALLMMNVVLVQLVLWSNQPGFQTRFFWLSCMLLTNLSHWSCKPSRLCAKEWFVAPLWICSCPLLAHYILYMLQYVTMRGKVPGATWWFCHLALKMCPSAAKGWRCVHQQIGYRICAWLVGKIGRGICRECETFPIWEIFKITHWCWSGTFR